MTITTSGIREWQPSAPDLHVRETAAAYGATIAISKPAILFQDLKDKISLRQKRDLALIHVMATHGIKDPWNTLHANRRVGATLSVSCASLQMESWGGLNIWGADPGGYALPGYLYNRPVTEHDFRHIYWPRVLAGDTTNGCGPSQLTSRGLQEAANRRGGCWHPIHNMAVGFLFMKQLVRVYGSTRLAFQSYNGSGPAAERYGYLAEELEAQWHYRFSRIK